MTEAGAAPGAVQGAWITPEQTGGMEVYRVAPPGDGAAPTVILLQEIFGVNAPMRDFAATLADEGYEVLAPDLFWRSGPRIDLSYEGADRATAAHLMAGFDTEDGLADTGRVIAWLQERDGDGVKLAAIGFCLGGKLATLLATRGEVVCGISFYGVELDGHVAEIAAAPSRLLLHFGEKDAQVPPNLARQIAAAARDNANVEVHVHDGAPHGFFNPSRPERYHAGAAATAGARTRAVLREVLG